jgi:hypothetical protein
MAAIAWWWHVSTASAFASVPYAYLPSGVVTGDPGEFIIHRGGEATPPERLVLPDGRLAFPAYSHPAVVAPGGGGRLLYFPAQPGPLGHLATPPLPPWGQPLPAAEQQRLRRVMSEEALILLNRALEVQP